MSLHRRLPFLVPLTAATGVAVAAVALLQAAPPPVAASPSTRPAQSASGHDLTGWDDARADRVAKETLSELGYYVTREEGTERPFTSELLENAEAGVYACAVCELPVYASETKFESGTGWPSFYEEVDSDHVRRVEDRSLGMVRTEVECARCDSHLGHVFDDGPEPTGLRHCINGVALTFEPAESTGD